MEVGVVSVGRPGRLLESAIAEYEGRAARYWKLRVTTVRAEAASRNRPPAEVRRAEAGRLRSGAPAGHDLIGLTRAGEAWSSERLAEYLEELGVRGAPGTTFLVGGASGLDPDLLRECRFRLSLSPMTLPHDLARLVLAEQLYRAGTISRGEPYHKG
jgi:23S rRNA (pseudouridine1915-N3)-methyltransferase